MEMSAVAALSDEQAGCIQSGDSYTSPFSGEVGSKQAWRQGIDRHTQRQFF